MFSQTQQGTQSTASADSSTYSHPKINDITKAHAVLLMNEMNSSRRQEELMELLKEVCQRNEELTAQLNQLVLTVRLQLLSILQLNGRVKQLEQVIQNFGRMPIPPIGLSNSSILSSSFTRTVSFNPGVVSLAGTTGSASAYPMTESAIQAENSLPILLSSQSNSSSSAGISSLISPSSSLNSSWFFGRGSLPSPMRLTSTTTQTRVTNLMLPSNCFFKENTGSTDCMMSIQNNGSTLDPDSHKKPKPTEIPSNS